MTLEKLSKRSALLRSKSLALIFMLKMFSYQIFSPTFIEHFSSDTGNIWLPSSVKYQVFTDVLVARAKTSQYKTHVQDN